MSLFQRIRTPFTEKADDQLALLPGGAVSVGMLLRERREELGLDLDAVGAALRIKPIYLAALEQGDTEELPGPTYAAGFIRSYAQLLQVDSDRILESYKAAGVVVQPRPDLSLPLPLDARSLPRGPILLVGLILAACGYGTWYYLSTGEHSRPARVAAVPADLQREVQGNAATPGSDTPPAPIAPAPAAVSGVLPPPSAAALPAPPGEPAATSTAATGPGITPAAAALPPAGSASSGSASARETPLSAAPAAEAGAKPAAGIDLRALADCWIQVRSGDDQSIVFSRVLKTGETYHVPRAGLVMRTGNAGALSVVVDGKQAPALGGVGVLRRNVALDPQELLAGTAVHG